MGDFVTVANLATYLQNDVDTASATLAKRIVPHIEAGCSQQ